MRSQGKYGHVSKRRKKKAALILAAAVILLCSFILEERFDSSSSTQLNTSEAEKSVEIPEYIGEPSVKVDNEPSFSEKEKRNERAFEKYSRLDHLGRCGTAFANICPETMPEYDRGDISSVHPSGWISGLGYNRCHLIGFQLAGENANDRNLITGTQYFNVSGMLPYENMIADYVKETSNHVLYRVTPVFVGKELVARGVQMEAWSVEDDGDGICFNVYCFNVFEDGYPEIDYQTGDIDEGY